LNKACRIYSNLHQSSVVFVALLKWILYTSLFAVLCAVGLCMATEKLLSGHVPGTFQLFMALLQPIHFVFIICINNIKNIPTGISDRADWSARKQMGTSFSHSFRLLAFLVLPVLSAPQSDSCKCRIGLIVARYSLPVLPFPQKKRLKDWGILKLILLALVWTCVTVLMPMFYYNKSFKAYEVEFLLRFVFMLPLCIAFDIRDMETDKENSIYTLPNAIGLNNSYKLMDICLIAFCGLAIWQYFRYPVLSRLWSGLFIVVLTKIMLQLSKKVDTDIFYLLCIDGMMLVYALFILIA
jgi:hypothetical protein